MQTILNEYISYYGHERLKQNTNPFCVVHIHRLPPSNGQLQNKRPTRNRVLAKS